MDEDVPTPDKVVDVLSLTSPQEGQTDRPYPPSLRELHLGAQVVQYEDLLLLLLWTGFSNMC